MNRRFSGTALACLALLLTLAPVALAQEDKQDDKAEATKTAKLASITLEGSLAESPGQAGLFGEIEPNLREMISRLEKAADDDAIAGVVLRLREPTLGRGKLAELRAAIAGVREKGKKVYAQLDSADTASYLVACACDEIVLSPAGTLMIPGVRMETVYVKGLLDRVGLEADFLHVGAYKGAAEPLTRTEMSPEVRENLTQLVDDFYDQLLDTIAEDRDIDRDQAEKLVDQGLFTADQAKDAGLVDRVAYDDQWQAALRDQMEVDELSLDTSYGKQKVDTDFSGPTGFFKLMQMMMGDTGKSSADGKSKIALVYAVGPIMTGKSTFDLLGESIMGSDTIVAALKKANEDKSVKAIVLRIDSPGGSALASDLIWRETVRIEKPIVASMGDVAGSGGYYIAMGADRIFAEPGTITGSIGVVGGKIALDGLLDKINIQTQVIARGKNSGIFSTTGQFTDAERDALRAMLEDVYRQFTTKAAQGREMELDKLEALAGGRVYSGVRAKELGLVDELGTLQEAVASARTLAGIEEGTETELLILPKHGSLLEQLLGLDEEEVSLPLRLPVDLSALSGELRWAVQTADHWRRLFRQPAATMMPFELRIR
ncbi:MAG: signal peptide peptidase SppA [Pirellulales bacterium]